MRRQNLAVFIFSIVVVAGPLSAATITETGPLFDVEYDDTGFLWQTGTFIDDEGMVQPQIDQLGGYTIINPTTIRYSLPPEETFEDPFDPTIWQIVPGGDIEVGGFPFLTSDSASGMGMFDILPKLGQRISGVEMTVNGSFNNPTEDASILFAEGMTAGGDSDSNGLSLGIFSSGPLPSGLMTTFPETAATVGTTFDFSLDGSSSDPFDFSFATISSIDFVVTVVPEPGLGLLALLLVALAPADMRRRAGLSQ